MKNKLLALISLLLVSVLLLASCKDPDDGSFEAELNPMGGSSAVADAAAKWAEYISFNAPEADAIYNANKILSELETAGVVRGDILEIAEVEAVTVIPEDEGEITEPEEIRTGTRTTYQWYDVNTGKLVRSFVSFAPTITAGSVHESVDLSAVKSYAISYAGDDYRVIRVDVTSYVLKEAEAPAEGEPEALDPLVRSNYDTVVTYNYYRADGSELLTNLENYINVRSVNNQSAREAGRYLVDVEELDKTFLMEYDQIVATFAYRMEYDIPVYDEETVNVNGAGYAYFEYKGNKYLVNEAAAVAMPMGDLYLVLVPGITINVTDSANKALVTYTSECYGISGYAVLSNGNVYICEYELLNRDAEVYDIKSGEEKLNINHKIISVTDGSVTSLDLSYKASKIFNDNTKNIRSFLNITTMEATDENITSALLSSVDVADGYMLAEIQKYADGVLSSDTVFAVLNESLEIVAELPKLIANQFTYPSFVDADTMIVSTRTANNKVVYYAVDADGDIFVLPSVNQLKRIQPITNGYVWWNSYGKCKIYDESWNLLKDYTKEDSSSNDKINFRVINGALYYDERYYYNYEDTDEYNNCIRKASIEKVDNYDGEYRLELNDIDYKPNAEKSQYKGMLVDLYSYVQRDYYNIERNVLFSVGENRRSENVYDENNSYYYYYEADVTLDRVMTTEAGYLVRLKVEWSRSEYEYTTTDLPISYIEYEYYIVK